MSRGALLYYEDFRHGQTFTAGPFTLTAGEIIEYARLYDPQPFHTDQAAARDSFFGGLVAAGWHTVAIAMRLKVDHLLSRTAIMASPGADTVRWPRPTRPGDRLFLHITVTAKRRVRRHTGRGRVYLRIRLENQDRKPVLTHREVLIVQRRRAASS